ncbi:MAG TPA: DinB family protein [Chthonomonadales bacterium]|nr:DinB family protein [Chthonomonadales bacterium]
MPYCASDVAAAVRASRRRLSSHLVDLGPEQQDCRPCAACMSIGESLAHLVSDDRAALEAMTTGPEPDYAAFDEPERDTDALRANLETSHDQLGDAIERDLAASPMEVEISAHASPVKLDAVAVIRCSEDYYLAGQVAFIRLATDPAWNNSKASCDG